MMATLGMQEEDHHEARNILRQWHQLGLVKRISDNMYMRVTPAEKVEQAPLVEEMPKKGKAKAPKKPKESKPKVPKKSKKASGVKINLKTKEKLKAAKEPEVTEEAGDDEENW